MSTKKKPVAIIGAMDEEISELLKHSKVNSETKWNVLSFIHAEIENQKVVIVKSGVGKVFAAMISEKLIDEFDPKAVIFTGVAGALNSELNIGDVVVSTDCIQHDLDVQALGFMRGAIPFTEYRVFKADPMLREYALKTRIRGNKVIAGRILTGDQFITKHEMKDHKYLVDELKGDAIEMEGGAVAQVCTLSNVPFLIVRTMSDKADGTAATDFAKFLPRAAKNSYNVVRTVLRNL